MSYALTALAVALLVPTAFLACSSGASMQGGSKDEQKKETASSDDAKKEEAKRPKKRSEAADTDDEEDDSDLNVIPPEVVSAAFLTCSTSDTGTVPQEGAVHLGCVIKDEHGEKLAITTASEDWSLKTASGDAVSYDDIEVPAGSPYQKIYGLTQATYDAGVQPEVLVKAGNDEVIPVKRKGKVSINGKEVQ